MDMQIDGHTDEGAIVHFFFFDFQISFHLLIFLLTKRKDFSHSSKKKPTKITGGTRKHGRRHENLGKKEEQFRK